MRVWRLAGWPALLLAAALGLAGCATQTAQSDTDTTTRIALPAKPAPAERVASAKFERKIAAPKTEPKQSAVAQPSPRPQAAGEGEASCAGVDTCATVLKAMVTGPDRSWVRRPAAPGVLANGVRLFAYRALTPTLSCGELSAALSEVETAERTFAGAGTGLEPEQVERVRSLCAEVGGELRAERARRCPPPNKVG